jgi:lysophospholipase L1-like esterase
MIKTSLKIFLFNFAAFLLLVIGAHLIHELFIYEPKKVIEGARSNFEYHPFPYISFKGIPGEGYYNEEGYRSPVPVSNELRRGPRIFLLGGSSLVNGTQTLAQLLQNRFDNEGIHVEIYNRGVVSSAIRQDLSRLVHEIVDHNPDLIIFYHGFNELMNQLYGDPRVGYPFNFWISENNPLHLRKANEFPLLKMLLLRSTIARQYFPRELESLVVNTEKYNQEVNKFSEGWEQEIVNDYWQSLEKFKELEKAFGYKTMVFFQPVFFGHPDYKAQDDGRNEHHKSFKRMFHLLMNDPRRKEFSYNDLSKFFDDQKKSPFRDDVHINDKGREKVADAIYPMIKRQVEALNQ